MGEITEEMERMLRANVHQVAAEQHLLELVREERELHREQRFREYESAVAYHDDGSPVCRPIRIGTAEMDRPRFLRFFRMYPNKQQPEKTVLMRAARLALEKAYEAAGIYRRGFTLLFVGEQIPPEFAPRAEGDGGVYQDVTTNLRTPLACSLNSERSEITVPTDTPVTDACIEVIALLLFHFKQRHTAMPAFETKRKFGDPEISIEADEHRREWLAELRRLAYVEAQKLWGKIGAEVMKEAGL